MLMFLKFRIRFFRKDLSVVTLEINIIPAGTDVLKVNNNNNKTTCGLS